MYLDNKSLAKLMLKCLISRKARRKFAEVNPWAGCHRLIMTYVIRDEADTIEKCIRFHAAMGVDGFIVSSHNSVDGTNEILEKLKKEGLVLEILYRQTHEHHHSEWVNEMVHIAKHKYRADWVINADGDELYYSDKLDLKKSILECGGANSLWVDSLFVFPTNEENCLENTYFAVRPLQKFEAEMAGVADDPDFAGYIGSQGCTKVIHRTRGFKSVCDGNHLVELAHERKCHAAGIRLYHLHIRNYKGYEAKVRRWSESAKLMPEGMCDHLKCMVSLYEKGELRADYERRFGEKMKQRLLELGVIAFDPSARNFMHWKGIL